MSNITFLQYTPHQQQEKKRNILNTNACSHCRKAHAACTSHRPCDRCVRMQYECVSTPAHKKKKESSQLNNNDNNNINTNYNNATFIDVDTVSQMLFSDNNSKQQIPQLPLHQLHQQPQQHHQQQQQQMFAPSFSNNTNTFMNQMNNFTEMQSASFLPIETLNMLPMEVPTLSPSHSFSNIPSPQSFSHLSTPSPLSSHSSSSLSSPSTPQYLSEDCCSDSPNDNISVMTTNATHNNIITHNTSNGNSDSRIDELIAQNMRMEMRLATLSRQVDYLQTKIEPSGFTATGACPAIPATATWKLPDCELLECNRTFMELLGFSDSDKSITFFELGACTKALGKIRKKIEYSTQANIPLKDPPHSKTIPIPIIKKNKEVILMNVTAIVYLDCPVPILTTVLHRIAN